ncbi:MAG: SdiA-regulated domain-containing protein [Vicinamibacteria bacterium]|nr:SdiA-regulated domain-containing protein [Vicinamibacteria bacterium]
MNPLDSNSDAHESDPPAFGATPVPEGDLNVQGSEPGEGSEHPNPDQSGVWGRDESKPDKKNKKKAKKEEKTAKKAKAEIRQADPWQRYKAMIDSLKEAQDLVDLADHKARFALIIMGALNAAIIILGTRSELLSDVPPQLKTWLYAYFVVYTVIAVYFLVQAIESLRPRSVPDMARKGSVSEKEESLGLRFFADALRYDAPTYQKAWMSVRVSQLNAELSTQLYTIARINKAKYHAVAKLYLGLQAIIVLTAGLLVGLGTVAWIQRSLDMDATARASADGPVKIKAGKPKMGGWSILGEPERLAAVGVREPSGIVFAPGRGTFFVVGDEGSLVEISKEGALVAQFPVGGNLEDVAFHSPSGRLVLLSEKKGELIVFDPATGKQTAKFKLDDAALLGEDGVDKNQGFEGLAFRKEAGRPGGGVFYLVHQRAPAVLIILAFDPLAASGRIGAEALVSRITMGGRADLTAVTYDSALDRLFVVADSKDRVAMLTLSGQEEAEIVLPGVQQEGVAFDPAGNLWIADDRAGLLVFRGARAKIATEMR